MAYPFKKKRGPRFRVETFGKIEIRSRNAIASKRARKYLELEKKVHRARLRQKAAVISKVRHPPSVGMGWKEISPTTLKQFKEKGKVELRLSSRPRAFKRKNLIRAALIDFYDLLRTLRPIGGEISFRHPEIKEWIHYWDKKIGGNWREEVQALARAPGHLSMRELMPYLSSIARIRWKK